MPKSIKVVCKHCEEEWVLAEYEEECEIIRVTRARASMKTHEYECPSCNEPCWIYADFGGSSKGTYHGKVVE